MNNPVSGESSARGYFSLILRLVRQPWQSAARNFGTLGMWRGAAGLARHGPARQEQGMEYGKAGRGWAGRGLARPERGKEYGIARHGQARPGKARHGTWAGVTTSKHKTHTEHGNNTTQH